MVVALPIATALNANTQSISTARARVSIEVAAMDSIEKPRARVAMVIDGLNRSDHSQPETGMLSRRSSLSSVSQPETGRNRNRDQGNQSFFGFALERLVQFID
jgi:hypothetical protein